MSITSPTTPLRASPFYIIELLRDLGYRPRLRPDTDKDFLNEFQMVLNGWAPDFPAASTFFVNLLTCHAPNSFDKAFCDRRIDKMIHKATKMQLEDATAAGALWAEIDRAIVHEAPNLWFANPKDVQFVSERVDNYQHAIEWGELLIRSGSSSRPGIGARPWRRLNGWRLSAEDRTEPFQTGRAEPGRSDLRKYGGAR